MLVVGLGGDDGAKQTLHFVEAPEFLCEHGLVVEQLVVVLTGLGFLCHQLIGAFVLLVVPKKLHFGHHFLARIFRCFFRQGSQQFAGIFQLALLGKDGCPAALRDDHVIGVVNARQPAFSLSEVLALLGNLSQGKVGLHQSAVLFR